MPDGSWLLLRTGWSARAQDEGAFLNADENGPHTPGPSVAAARWLAEECSITGFGVETVGIDAGSAGGMDPPFPGAPLPAGRGHLRPDPAAEPRPAAHHRGRAGGDAVADRRGHRQSGPRGGAGRALDQPDAGRRARRPDAGPAGRRTRVRRRRQWQLRDDQRPAGRRGAVRRRRGTRAGAASMADALRPDEWSGHRAVGAPGAGADQRRHGHHGGGQEPYPAAGAGRRRRCRRGALELPNRLRRPGRGPPAQCRSGCTRHETAVDDVVTRVANRPQRPPHGGPQRAPGRAGRRRPSRARSSRCPRPVPIRSGKYATKQLANLLNAAERPVFLAGRGAIASPQGAAGSGPAVRRAAGHVGGGEGTLRRRSVRPGHLRRLRHAAGRRVDHRCGPAGGLGLQPHDVDDRHGGIARARRPRSCRSTTTSPHSGRAGPSPLALPATWARPPRRCSTSWLSRNPESRYRRPDVQRRIADRGPLDQRARRRRPVHRRHHRPAGAEPWSWSGGCHASAWWRSTPATSWATRPAYLSVPDPAGFCFTQSFQSIGLGLGHRDRRGAGAAPAGCRCWPPATAAS